MTRARRSDTGSAAVQLAPVVVLVVLLICAAVFVGRVSSSEADADAAARYAARTLSLARDPAAAIEIARTEAEDTVGLGSKGCASMDFTHDIDPDRVTVTVTCSVDLSDVDLPGMPGEWSVTATAQEPIDPLRETTAT